MNQAFRGENAAQDGAAGRSNTIFRACGFSLAGLAHAFRSERAFRQEILLLVFGLPLSFLATEDFFRRAVLVAALLMVLAVELLNTGLEKLCDRINPSPDPVVKAIKDMGSAAVFCTLLACGLLWGGALWTRLF